jgi:chromosome segregation ATPase
VKGRGPASLSTIDVRRVEQIFEPKEDMKSLYGELRKLEKQRKKINDEIQIHSQRLANIRGMVGDFAGNFGMLFAASEAKIDQLVEMDSKSDKLVESVKKKIRELEDQLKETQDQITIIRSNIGEIESRRRSETSFDVEISLEVKDKGEVQLEIAYQVGGARWLPSRKGPKNCIGFE